jgi:hypothetical protein
MRVVVNLISIHVSSQGSLQVGVSCNRTRLMRVTTPKHNNREEKNTSKSTNTRTILKEQQYKHLVVTQHHRIVHLNRFGVALRYEGVMCMFLSDLVF